MPAPKLVILASRRCVDWVDAMFAAPPEMDCCPNGSKAERQSQCEVAYRIVEADSASGDDEPFEDFAPPGGLDLEYGED